MVIINPSRTRCLLLISSFSCFNQFAVLLCSFLTLQISPQNFLLSSAFRTSVDLSALPLNSVYIFFQSTLETLLYLNCVTRCSYLFCFAFFAKILCLSSSITAFIPFLLTLYLSSRPFNFRFFLLPNSPFDSLYSVFTSCFKFLISFSMKCFNHGSFQFVCFSNVLHFHEFHD